MKLKILTGRKINMKIDLIKQPDLTRGLLLLAGTSPLGKSIVPPSNKVEAPLGEKGVKPNLQEKAGFSSDLIAERKKERARK